jgi:PAS domain S-box-containing protein
MKPEVGVAPMSSNLLEDPKLFRHVLEDLPVGVYILDREQRIVFWNHSAEQLVGRFSHEVVGHAFGEVLQACDSEGKNLTGDQCPVTTTLRDGQPHRSTAFYLHKAGHRVTVEVRSHPIYEHGDAIKGASVLFEEIFAEKPRSSAPATPTMYGCLDATTGIPSHRLTRAVLNECIAEVAESHHGFGLVLIRLLKLDAFRAKHGPQSIIPFVRTAAHTLRHSLDTENFLGCWGENEFIAVLPSASPVTVATTAETLWNLLSHSQVSWWGDRFSIEAEVVYTIATAGKSLDSLLQEMKPSHSSGAAKAAAAGAVKNSGSSRG